MQRPKVNKSEKRISHQSSNINETVLFRSKLAAKPNQKSIQYLNLKGTRTEVPTATFETAQQAHNRRFIGIDG